MCGWLAGELLNLICSIEIVIHHDSRWSDFHLTLRCLSDDRRLYLHARLCTPPIREGRKRSLNRCDCALISFGRFLSSIALVSLASRSLCFGSIDFGRFLHWDFSRFVNSFVSLLISSFLLLQSWRDLKLNLICSDLFRLFLQWSCNISNKLRLCCWKRSFVGKFRIWERIFNIYRVSCLFNKSRICLVLLLFYVFYLWLFRFITVSFFSFW